ncbi:MAG: hypothetical protein ACI9MR_002816 [Myxococcota bacterium]|jgi:hypothetical protein
MRLLSLLSVATLSAATLAGPAMAESQPPAPAQMQFDQQLKRLATLAACAGPVSGLDSKKTKVAEGHCAALQKIRETYQAQWHAIARPFFDSLVPADVPKTVVYPFGGADLLTVLAVFPDVTDLTSLSLEAGGDPRHVGEQSPKALKKSLKLHRQFIDKLVTVNHSRTLDLARLKGDPLPSQVIFALVGLDAHGFEAVSLRYFVLTPAGVVDYLDASEIAAADAELATLKGSRLNRKRAELFGNYELMFRSKGDARAPLRTYRHLSANLDNAHLAADDRVLKHLLAKGKITAITKAASYLLWWGNFATIRSYLMENMVWMVSDSTGIPPNLLDPSAFEQVTYGKFRATAITGSKEGTASFKALWKDSEQRPLPFMFGYPSKGQHAHLVVTRRK